MATKRVLINDLILFRERTGIATYVAELIAHFPQDVGLEIVRLSDTLWGKPLTVAMRLYAGAASESPEEGDVAPRPWARVARAARRFGHTALDRYLTEASRLARIALYHEPDTIPFLETPRAVVTVHDLSVVLFPDWHPEHRVRRYEKRLPGLLRSENHFIAVSEATKKDMTRHLGVAESRIRVIPEAPRPIFRPSAESEVATVLARHGLSGEYFLFVGTLEPRKNVEGLLRAFSTLPERLRRRFPLVLAGGFGWKSEAIRSALQSKSLRGSVFHLGYVSDRDLVALCTGATALVYPSFYEGFGFPPLEAMACGAPVVTTSRGALAETVGNAALIVDPEDEEGIAAALRLIAENPDVARDYRERGLTHVRKFDWARTARATAELYRELA